MTPGTSNGTSVIAMRASVTRATSNASSRLCVRVARAGHAAKATLTAPSIQPTSSHLVTSVESVISNDVKSEINHSADAAAQEAFRCGCAAAG